VVALIVSNQSAGSMNDVSFGVDGRFCLHTGVATVLSVIGNGGAWVASGLPVARVQSKQ